MINTSINFCGLSFPNPIIIASSPLTESYDGILRCQDAGAGGIITKSIGAYNESEYPIGARRVHSTDGTFWAHSSFRRETIPLKKGVDLVRKASRHLEIPMIASITGLGYEIDNWLPACEEIKDAGADILQLDLFYLPQPIVSLNNINKLIFLLSLIVQRIQIPIIIKLNISIPSFFAAINFDQCGIAGFSLLDSVRVPSPFDIFTAKPYFSFLDHPGQCSKFGPWQKPLTEHYAITISRLSARPFCAGGGLSNSRDAIEMMMLGATLVQFASAIINNGYQYISFLKEDLTRILDSLKLNSVSDIVGLVSKQQNLDFEKSQTKIINAKALIDESKCIQCEKCLDSAFCNAIYKKNQSIRIESKLCDGCGFCIEKCTSDALSLVASD